MPLGQCGAVQCAAMRRQGGPTSGSMLRQSIWVLVSIVSTVTSFVRAKTPSIPTCQDITMLAENYLEIYLLLTWTLLDVIAGMMYQETDVNGQAVWKCTECGQESKRKDNLTSHIEVKHLTNPGLICSQCSTFCPSRNALRMHVSRKHRK